MCRLQLPNAQHRLRLCDPLRQHVHDDLTIATQRRLARSPSIQRPSPGDRPGIFGGFSAKREADRCAGINKLFGGQYSSWPFARPPMVTLAGAACPSLCPSASFSLSLSLSVYYSHSTWVMDCSVSVFPNGNLPSDLLVLDRLPIIALPGLPGLPGLPFFPFTSRACRKP